MRHKRLAKTNIGIDLDERVIAAWQQFGTIDVALLRMDACDFLSSYTFTGSELVYCDPPYLTETRRRHKIYRHEYSIEDHEKLLDLLICLPCQVIISGYENPMYRERLSGWHSRSFSAVMRQGKATETVWFNYPPPVQLHDERYMGSNYREREKIKRRMTNLKRKITEMNAHERQAFMHWMIEEYGHPTLCLSRQVSDKRSVPTGERL